MFKDGYTGKRENYRKLKNGQKDTQSNRQTIFSQIISMNSKDIQRKDKQTNRGTDGQMADNAQMDGLINGQIGTQCK